MNNIAWRAARATTLAAFATKDAVTSAASTTKKESKNLFGALKAGAAAAREERAKQRAGALDPRNKVEVK